MRLTLVQLDQTAGDVDRNLDRAESRIREAVDAGADLVALPELFSVGYGKFEAKASPFRASPERIAFWLPARCNLATGMKPTNSMQPPTVARTGFQRNL